MWCVVQRPLQNGWGQPLIINRGYSPSTTSSSSNECPCLREHAPPQQLHIDVASPYFCPDMEQYRRPLESPKGSNLGYPINNYVPVHPHPVHPTMASPTSGPTPSTSPPYNGHYYSYYNHDYSETSSTAASTQMTAESPVMQHNVTTNSSTADDESRDSVVTATCNQKNTFTSLLLKKSASEPTSVYLSTSEKDEPRRMLFRACVFFWIMIALVTVLSALLLIFATTTRHDLFASYDDRDGLMNPAMVPLLPNSLRVIPTPTNLVDRNEIIVVNRRNPSTYENQANQLKRLIKQVDAINGTRRDPKFPTNLIAPECNLNNEDYYGYRTGEPCVAVVLTPNEDFVPIGTQDPDLLEIQCRCENRDDVEIRHSPYKGFPRRFFPRSHDASPLLVMLHFTEETPLKTELRISCSLINAKNVDPERDRVTFNLIVI